MIEDKPTGACAGNPGPWESIRPKEEIKAFDRRQRRAKIDCHRCPILDACERYLSACEKQKIPIDGVVAGRWPDWTKSEITARVKRLQKHCRHCGHPMRPQWRATDPNPRNVPQHVGEGLCNACWPTHSRAARHPERTHTMINLPDHVLDKVTERTRASGRLNLFDALSLRTAGIDIITRLSAHLDQASDTINRMIIAGDIDAGTFEAALLAEMRASQIDD